MVKLRFICPWGPYKVGDIKETASGTTIKWLVDIYKFAVIEPPKIAFAPKSYVSTFTAPKNIFEAPKDKMVRLASNKKRRGQSGPSR